MFNVHVNILKQRQKYEHNIGLLICVQRQSFLFVSYTTQIYAPKSLSAVSVVKVFTILGIGVRQKNKVVHSRADRHSQQEKDRQNRQNGL